MDSAGIVLSCKCCGAPLNMNSGKKIIECSFCGQSTLLPDNPIAKRLEAFNRGNEYRRKNEFEKAVDIYVDYLKENPDDVEAHWQCALARFGIEYVKDPDSNEYIPTCHRANFDSFAEDLDYQAAIKYSDGEVKEEYTKEAERIDRILTRLIEVARHEKPYDVFICYKESINNERTPDSVRAYDLYELLTQRGYRVFFARVTLENMIGEDYEPIIFAALNSAKVMLVVGSSRDNFEAVWVKNEWQRFLAIMEKDRAGRLIIPCYFNMNPSDMPTRLARTQSVNLDKIGVNQDILLAISKYVKKEEKHANQASQSMPSNNFERPKGYSADEILDMVKTDLRRGKYASALNNSKNVLANQPNNERALLLALLADNNVKEESLLKKKMSKSVEKSPYYKRLLEVASEETKKKIEEYKKSSSKHKTTNRIIKAILLTGLILVVAISFVSIKKKADSKKIDFYCASVNEINDYYKLSSGGESFIDEYKKKAENSLKQKITKPNDSNNYSVTVGDIDYLGYAFAHNDNNKNCLYFFYEYNVDFAAKAGIEKGTFTESQKLIGYVGYKDIGVRKNGEIFISDTPEFVSENYTIKLADINYIGEIELSCRGYKFWSDAKDMVETDYSEIDYSFDEDSLTLDLQPKNLVYYAQSNSQNILYSDMKYCTDNDGNVYGGANNEVIAFMPGLKEAGSAEVSYSVPDGYNNLSFMYTAYPMYAGSNVTVNVIDADTKEVLFEGEKVKEGVSSKVDLDISGHNKIGIVVTDNNNEMGWAVIKNIILSKKEISKE